jgi:hypothetical protein
MKTHVLIFTVTCMYIFIYLLLPVCICTYFIHCIKDLKGMSFCDYQGRIQELKLGGGGTTLFEAWGLGAALKPPVGSGQNPFSPPEAPRI